MKKTMTRIAACSLAVLIAFGSVCYKPPKARAFGVESAFAAAATFSYLEAVGMSFEGTAYDGMRDSLLDIFVDLSENFVNGLGILRHDFEAIVAEGVDFLENGHVRISSAAANMLAQFSDWLVDKLGLIGEDGVPVADPVGIVANTIAFPALPAIDMTMYPYVILWYNPMTGVYRYYRAGSDAKLFFSNSEAVQLQTSGTASYWYYDEAKAAWFAFDEDVSTLDIIRDYIVASSFPIYDSAGTLCVPASDVYAFAGVEDWENPAVTVLLPADYEAAPTVDEQYSMVIDTGMTFEDEQEFIDAVLGDVAAGTLSPTYDIEYTGNRDVVVPGEVTDTQAGILSWVKTIAQRVSALPQSIAEAVKSVFVPDAALTTQITDAFAAKFSFVPTLHRLGTDLLSIGPDSKPPVVYIHLEDAEGTIDYGGTVKALDMSWYERYKEDGDRIIGGFLWLGFLWLLFKRVPAIINGGEMVQEYTADIDRGSKRRKQ